VTGEETKRVIRHRWRTHLKNAATEADVVDLVQAYLAEWTAQEIRSLPGAAWPGRIRERADIMSWMFRVGEVHAHFRGDAAALARLQELLLVFTHAAVRVTQIAAKPAAGSANDEATGGNGLECAPQGASGSQAG
jgi:hypothetical protein